MNMQNNIDTEFIYKPTIHQSQLILLYNKYTENNSEFSEHFNSISRSEQIEIAKCLICYNSLDFLKN